MPNPNPSPATRWSAMHQPTRRGRAQRDRLLRGEPDRILAELPADAISLLAVGQPLRGELRERARRALRPDGGILLLDARAALPPGPPDAVQRPATCRLVAAWVRRGEPLDKVPLLSLRLTAPGCWAERNPEPLARLLAALTRPGEVVADLSANCLVARSARELGRTVWRAVGAAASMASPGSPMDIGLPHARS